MTDQPIRVFLLDDHEVVRRGLRDLLEGEGDIEVQTDEAFRNLDTMLRAGGGGNNNLLIHTGSIAQGYIAEGILEETFVHESAHTSLDAYHAASPGWLAAQAADMEFISTYARDNPTQEDVAESFLPWLMLQLAGDRIDPAMKQTIEATIPARLAYFDAQGFDLRPQGDVDAVFADGFE